MSGGPPSRGPEILSIRHRNTFNGGLRNIGIENGMMFFAPRTHKNYMQRGKEKVVHHFLPREIGELLMYWLWIVLPFWDKVQISIDADVRSSAFLWGGPASSPRKESNPNRDSRDSPNRDNPDRDSRNSPNRDSPENNRNRDSPENNPNRDSPDRDNPYTRVGPWHREWNSERLSKIMRREGMKAMNAKLGISAWRNMVEAISIRFLRHPFEFDETEEWKDEATEW